MKILNILSIPLVFYIFLLILGPLNCAAKDTHDFLRSNKLRITRLEFRALPDYCQSKLYYHNWTGQGPKKSMTQQKWIKNFGPDYLHLHHYCWGIIKYKRATAVIRDDQKRNFLFKSAMNEFNYMIKNVPPNSPFLWLYYQKKGEALLMQNKFNQAQIELMKSKFYRKRSQKK